jgi:hypothetical protein
MANMIVYLVSWNTQVISSSRGADSGWYVEWWRNVELWNDLGGVKELEVFFSRFANLPKNIFL